MEVRFAATKVAAMHAAARLAVPSMLLVCFAMRPTEASASNQGYLLPHLWSAGFGDPDEQKLWTVDCDDRGNVVVAGQFRGTIDFGGGALTSRGEDDICVAAFDAAGRHLWSQSFGDESPQWAQDVVADGAGITMIGTFYGSVDFGGTTLTSAGGQDVFVVRLDAAGSPIWSRRFGGVDNDAGNRLAIGEDGDVIIAGMFTGTTDLGNGPLVSAGAWDVYLARLNGTGNAMWSRGFGGGDTDLVEGLDADAGGRIVISGSYQSTIDFGGGSLPSASGFDAYIAGFDGAGQHVWSRGIGADGTQRGQEIALAGDGGVVAVGRFDGAIDLGLGPRPSAGDADIYVARYGPVGEHRWSRTHGGPFHDAALGVAVSGGGLAVVTGFYEGAVDLGGGALPAGGREDVFLAVFAPDGGHHVSRGFGDGARQVCWAVAVDRGREVALAGLFQGTVSFGGAPITSHGQFDAFIAKYLLGGPTTTQPATISTIKERYRK